ncbi:G-protein coupled receptor 54-like [Branchiostoma floridae]|uniref:G-protein coupled receptor 54-like n=1 Tax=Branchiostoma floridae TaxID=7739 RepID=A0A9J7MCG2_BRAFL|nr:G-protein coupled receptor 54-like [Branchiostoma floridae]
MYMRVTDGILSPEDLKMGSSNNETHGKETWPQTAATPTVSTWNDTKDDVLTAMAWDNITGNWTTESPAAAELVFGLDAWLVPMIFVALALIGLVGNSLVIHVILRDKAMHTATNYFILSLAVTDLTFIAFSVPFTASTYFLPSWVFGEFMCKFVMYMNQVTVTATCITLAAMTVDRCVSITRPLASHRWRTPRMAKVVSVCIWLASLLTSVPVAIYARLEDYYWAGPQVYCAEFYPSWAWAAGYATWSFIAAYLLPVVILTACCGWMVRQLWGTPVPGNIKVATLGYPVKNSNTPRASLTQQKRASLTVVMVVLLFAICWGPSQFLNMVRSYHPDFPFTMTTYCVKIWAHCMTYANSSVNPFVYAWLCGNFRKSFQKMLPRCLKKSPEPPSLFLTSTMVAKNWSSIMACGEDNGCARR